MAKYGLRSASGPFDWCFSDLEGVLHFVETDFSDFLDRNNLREDADKPREFVDEKYHLRFNHDIKSIFEKDYPNIYEKYMRRVENFRKQITKGVCFIRAVRDSEELEYIAQNGDYISRVVKKANGSNEIVFLLPYFWEAPKEFAFRHYILKIERYDGSGRKALRGLFDTNEEFIAFCNDNLNESIRKENLIFDMRKELKFYEKQYQIVQSRCQRLEQLARADFDRLSLPKKLIIYGAGNIGKIFYDKVKDRCKVTCFVDAAPMTDSYDNVPIVAPDKIGSVTERVIVVIPTYDYDKIAENLNRVCDTPPKIVPLETVLGQER